MQMIVTNAGDMEPAESSTIIGSLNTTLIEANVKTQDHCDTNMNSNLAWQLGWPRKKRGKRSSFHMFHEASSSSSRRLALE